MKTSTKKKPGLKRMLGIVALCLGLNATVNAQCSPSFTYATTSSSISLTSTSTGTTSSNYYNWSLSGTETRSVVLYNSTYTFNQLYNGTYTVSFWIDSALCSGVITQTVTISGGVNAPACSAGYTYSVGSAGSVTFTNTSSADPYNSSSYTWSFGDGSSVTDSTTATSPTHTFPYNGIYTVTLNVYNNLTNCSTSSSQTVSITNASSLPTCTSNFTYTLGASGLANFTSSYTGTAPNITYNWSFGDGAGYSISQNPSYTYPYNGTYSVSLSISDSAAHCFSSTTQTLSITNTATAPCAPTVSFYMHKDSLNPQPGIWEISPYYSSQVTNAVWFWGDGTLTAGLYPTHTYSVAGQYSVCVKVYSACGDSSTTCQNDSLYRLAQNNSTNSVIQITVINATAGIKTIAQETAQVSVYPNPSAGLFTLQLNNVSAAASKAQINITNILGEVIYTSQEQINNNGLSKEIDLQSIPNGAYFMKVAIGDKTFTHKTIISK